VDIEVAKVAARLKPRGIAIRLTAEATTFIIDKGYDPQYGARPLRRAVERHLEDPIAEELLRGSIKDNQLVIVNLKDGALTFTASDQSDTSSEKPLTSS
jgi:ATP-dependent Clp protease ATP-binding subunit ClpC